MLIMNHNLGPIVATNAFKVVPWCLVETVLVLRMLLLADRQCLVSERVCLAPVSGLHFHMLRGQVVCFDGAWWCKPNGSPATDAPRREIIANISLCHFMFTLLRCYFVLVGQ